MQPSLYAIPCERPGQLFIMPKPSGDWLEDDLRKLQVLGVDRIVSMLTAAESAELGLHKEAEICRSLGIVFTSVPVPDRQVPEPDDVCDCVASVAADLAKGKSVTVHCRAGIGRSGLIACCVLIALGALHEDAIKTVSASRGVPVPDTEAQRTFILSFVP